MEGIATFDDWQKIKLVVAEIINVEDIEGADKLWKLTLNGGNIGERTICAGIKQHYSKEELLNRKIIYFSNLVPRKLKGIESQGMLLAASNEDHSKIVLLTPEKDMEPGSIIS